MRRSAARRRAGSAQLACARSRRTGRLRTPRSASQVSSVPGTAPVRVRRAYSAARRTLTGAVPGTLETWLALRGVRSLPVRLERAQANCAELARRLAADRRIAAVRYPGLPQDPGHARPADRLEAQERTEALHLPGGGGRR